MTRNLTRWVLSLTLAAFSLTTLTGGGDGIREDELRCEEAKKHLIDCCGVGAAEIDCFYESGCSGTTYPDLDAKTAVCLRDASCDTLRAFGACGAPSSGLCE